jgi:hypothetical protein
MKPEAPTCRAPSARPVGLRQLERSELYRFKYLGAQRGFAARPACGLLILSSNSMHEPGAPEHAQGPLRHLD